MFFVCLSLDKSPKKKFSIGNRKKILFIFREQKTNKSPSTFPPKLRWLSCSRIELKNNTTHKFGLIAGSGVLSKKIFAFAIC